MQAGVYGRVKLKLGIVRSGIVKVRIRVRHNVRVRCEIRENSKTKKMVKMPKKKPSNALKMQGFFYIKNPLWHHFSNERKRKIEKISPKHAKSCTKPEYVTKKWYYKN